MKHLLLILIVIIITGWGCVFLFKKKPRNVNEVADLVTKPDTCGGFVGELPSCYKDIQSEIGEREVADLFTKPDACVLEFGGGAGNVATIVQQNLNNPSDHVVIQPQENGMFGGLEALKRNKESCNSKFHIIDHILKEGEGSQLLQMVSKPFDTIICDCEGCLHEEYQKNPELFEHVKMIQVERDDRPIEKNSYESGKYGPLLEQLKFKLVHKGDGCGGDCDTDVFVK